MSDLNHQGTLCHVIYVLVTVALVSGICG